MKKLISLLLALALVSLSAAALAETDLQALIDANAIPAINENYDTTLQRIEEYDPTDGSEAASWNAYMWHDENGAVLHAFEYSNGDWEIYGAGKGYGYSVATESVYVCGFVATAYEEYMLYLTEQNVGEFESGQQIVAEETTEDGKLLITVDGPTPAIYGEELAGRPSVSRYVVDPETLVIAVSDTYLVADDGSETLLYHCEHTVNVEVEIPDFYAEIESAETLREIHIIMDPGTEAEFDYVLEAPIHMPIAVFLPAGYELYEDAECTVPNQIVAETDENGNYPETLTLYAAPYAE